MQRRYLADTPPKPRHTSKPLTSLARPSAGTTTIAALSSFIIITAGVIGLARQMYLKDVVHNTLATQTLIQDYGADTQVYALQCRRYEKDFFLNIRDRAKRAGYLQKWNVAWDEMSEYIDLLEANWVYDDQGEETDFAVWRRNANDYKQVFLDIVDRIEAGEITSEAQANEVITPYKGYARRVIDEADEIKERAEEIIHEQNAGLEHQLSQTMTLSLFLMIVPAGLIVIGQLLFNRQMAAAQELLKEQNKALAAQEAETRKLALVASHTDSAVVICDADHHIEWVNQSFTRITEQTFDEVVGKTVDRAFAFTEDKKANIKLVQEHLEQGKPIQVEVAGETPSGRKYWLAADVQPVRDASGRIVNYVAVQRDITRQKQAEESLRHAARNDQLTSLPNRPEIHERIERAIDRRRSDPGSRFALLFLDFDRFKIINDSLGHDVGDMLLVEIANRLRLFIKAHATDEPWSAARLGGDEFVLLMEGIASLDEARTYADKLLQSLAGTYNLAGHEVRSTASIGIVFGDNMYQRAEEVIRDADTAMYRAKASGKARAVPFDREMLNAVQARQRLETDLHHAAERGELALEYQPIVSLDTGAVHGFEALVRWDHPRLGRIMPDEFIYIAEETGLILSVGKWITQTACRQIAAWRKTYPDTAWTMNINLSRNQLMNPGIVDEVRSAIQASGAEPGWIKLEITENSIMRDMETAIDVLNQFKSIGVKIVMDDFGTGHSSLHCIQELPLDMLKIDKSFVSNMETNLVYPAIIQSIATLTHNMKIGLVAEGIDTVNQVVQLQALECGMAQGYLFAPPMPPDQCMEHVHRRGDAAIQHVLKRSA